MTHIRRSRIGSLLRSVKRAVTKKVDASVSTRPRSHTTNQLTLAVNRMSGILHSSPPKRQVPLNYDLVRAILTELCSGNSFGSGSLAEIMQRQVWIQPLTLVSRLWRLAALPVYYNTVVCTVSTGMDGGVGVQWQPSINPLQHGSKLVRVQQLVIVISGLGDLDEVTERCLAVLRERRIWRNVKSLYVVLNDSPVMVGKWDRSTKEQVMRFNQSLATTLPQLRQLRYFSYVDDAMCPVFPLNLLVHTKLHELQHLDVFSGYVPRFPEVLPEVHLLSSLTLSSTRLESSTAAISQFSKTLVNLKLSLVPVATVWDGFLQLADLDPIEFPRLKTLAMKFDLSVDQSEFAGPEGTDADEVEPMRGPAFPALESLDISSYPRNISRLLRYFPCHRLSSLQLLDCENGLIHTDPGLFGCIASVRIRIAGDSPYAVAASVATQAQWVAGMLQAPGRLLHLRIDCIGAHLPISYLDPTGCAMLRKLTLFAKLDLQTIEQLIRWSPMLWYLCVRINDSHPYCDHQMGLSNREQYGDTVSHRLQMFAVYEPATAPQLCERKIVELVDLLARVPSLLALDMGYADTVRVLERVKGMRWHSGDKGKHLKKIGVSIV